MIRIDTVSEYNAAVQKGYIPLMDWRHFVIPIKLRLKIQEGLFKPGKSGDVDFYRWVWEHKPHYCEETMKPLSEYSAVYVSHILSRGAHPEMRHDPRNVNLLSFEAHQIWETGNRKGMRIYEQNLLVIDILFKDYGNEE